MKKYKIKIWYIISLILFFIVIIFPIRQTILVYQNQNYDYFNNLEDNTDIKNTINSISKKLHEKDYWLKWWHWWELLSHTFYWYSLVSLSMQDKDDKKLRKFVISELKFILKYINSERWKKEFINKNSDIPLGIIYNWHKNQTLAGLVILWEEKYKKELYENSDYIYWYLNKNESKNAETYEWRSWYVDNTNAIYSLYIVDLLRQRDWLDKKYETLIKGWIKYMKEHVWDYGMILAETETPNLENNQARWCALAWQLAYLYEIDENLFDEQSKLYNKYFYDYTLGLWVSRDVPKWQERINKIWGWPTILWYSSSATVLSLAMYKISENKRYFYDNLKAIDTLFFYNGKWEYIFWNSVLIDSLVLWWKTKEKWGEYF